MTIPYSPAKALNPKMMATMMITGKTVKIIPIPSPWIMTVAGPVAPASVMDWVGQQALLAKKSVCLFDTSDAADEDETSVPEG